MRNAALMSGIFAVVALGNAYPAVGQGVPPTAAPQERRTPIDAWLSTPDTIHLSVEQRKSVEDLKARFRSEFKQLRGEDEVAVVLQAKALHEKYQKLVRELLTPQQRPAFDRNVRRVG